MTATHRVAALCFTLLLGSIGSAQQPPADRVTPGEFTIEPPTLINLGFEWRIDGDANRNAKVEVSYRKVGPSTSLRASEEEEGCGAINCQPQSHTREAEIDNREGRHHRARRGADGG